MTLEELNRLPRSELTEHLTSCCAAKNWVSGMVRVAPYKSEMIMLTAAGRIWQTMGQLDYLSAFEAHPKIGDVSSLKQKFANTMLTASNEQSGMQVANDNVLLQMQQFNEAYFEKFGFIFIVCATGKSAEEMLDLIKARIGNDYETEIAIAAAEQMKITEIRLKKLLD